MPREVKLVGVIRGSCFTCKKPIGSQFAVRAIPLWLTDAEIASEASNARVITASSAIDAREQIAAMMDDGSPDSAPEEASPEPRPLIEEEKLFLERAIATQLREYIGVFDEKAQARRVAEKLGLDLDEILLSSPFDTWD